MSLARLCRSAAATVIVTAAGLLASSCETGRTGRVVAYSDPLDGTAVILYLRDSRTQAPFRVALDPDDVGTCLKIGELWPDCED